MPDANRQLANAAACNSDAENNKPGAKQNCSDIVNISVFFDGTGNNLKADTKDKKCYKWSNPARLWRAAQELTGPKTTNFAFYIAGVGTEFNKESEHWTETMETSIEDNAQGMGFGASSITTWSSVR